MMVAQGFSSLCSDVRDGVAKAVTANGVISRESAAEMTALLVSPSSDDHQSLSQMFSEKEWTLHRARTLGSALAMLRYEEIPVVITERDLPLGDWKDLLAAIRQLPHPPLVVVTSQAADEYLWAEVLNLGAHDVLAKPFNAVEVQWTLESAWRIWANRPCSGLLTGKPAVNGTVLGRRG